MSLSSSVQFSSPNSVSAVRSIILLNIMCLQLSEPQARVARKPNSIGDRNWAKNKHPRNHL